MRGLSVFTLPPRISGNPVYSSTGRVSMPCPPSSLAVPPVETISTPSATRPRANSTRPRLSDTLSSARRIRTSAGCAVSTSGVRGSAIRLHPHDARVGGIDGHAAGRDQAHRTRQQPVLDVMEALADGRDVPMVGKVERFLKQNRAAVHALVDEVDGHPRHLDAVLDGLLDRPEAGKC